MICVHTYSESDTVFQRLIVTIWSFPRWPPAAILAPLDAPSLKTPP